MEIRLKLRYTTTILNDKLFFAYNTVCFFTPLISSFYFFHTYCRFHVDLLRKISRKSSAFRNIILLCISAMSSYSIRRSHIYVNIHCIV